MMREILAFYFVEHLLNVNPENHSRFEGHLVQFAHNERRCSLFTMHSPEFFEHRLFDARQASLLYWQSEGILRSNTGSWVSEQLLVQVVDILIKVLTLE